MARVIQASWDAFDNIVGSAQSRLLICSPFYSEEGLGRLFDALPDGPGLKFVSRLSPSDWLNGVTDPVALTALLEMIRDDGRKSQFIVHQQLHAKAYLADSVRGLIGSANLSAGGFDRNFELMLDLDAGESAAADRMIEHETRNYGVAISVDSLRRWVDEHTSQINELRREEPDASELADVQRSLDGMLGYGGAGAIAEDMPDLDDFGAWLASDQRRPGAAVLVDRHRNVSGQNLTGHVRQSYYAAVRFLYEFPQHAERLALALDSMQRAEDIYQPDADLISDWIRHLNDHATDQGSGWNYAVLRGILPPNLGGTRLGGGGGISTLKRMLPLVARYLRHRTESR